MRSTPFGKTTSFSQKNKKNAEGKAEKQEISYT